MLKSYLLDTNIASYIIKNKHASLMKKLLLTEPSQINISAITKAELLFGVAKRPDIKNLALAVNEFLLRVNVLSWDDAAAESYANLRANLEKTGKNLANMDMLIAAQALAENAILVTNDQAFLQIKDLKIENWVT